MYYNGFGVTQNDTLAIEWLAAAASQGNEKAMESLRRIALAGRENALNTQKLPTITPIDARKTETLSTIHQQPLIENITETTTSYLPEVKTDVMAQTLASGTQSIEVQTTFTTNEQWIMEQSNKHYTIQLIATGNKAAMLRFIKKNNLRDNTVYYQTRRNDNAWFTLIQGSFKSLTLAKKAIKKLTSPLQTTKPWIKPIADIQHALLSR